MKWVSSVFSSTSLFTHRAILIAPFSCTSRSFPWLSKRPSRGRTLAGLENIALNMTTRCVVSFRNVLSLMCFAKRIQGRTSSLLSEICNEDIFLQTVLVDMHIQISDFVWYIFFLISNVRFSLTSFLSTIVCGPLHTLTCVFRLLIHKINIFQVVQWRW